MLDIFAATVARFPDRVAVESEYGDAPGALTYRQLDERSLELARTLSGACGGARLTDQVIAIVLPRESVELYVAKLAALRAGAAFTCIDAKFPDSFVATVLGESSAALVNAQSEERVARLAPRLRCVGIRTNATAAAIAAPDRRDLAYVIYTSGTTGAPKGVEIEHRSIANLVCADRDYFGLDETARVAQCSSPAYDSSLEETWLAWAVGGTLVLTDDATVRLGPDLIEWLRARRISVLCPPPTLLRSTGCADPERELPDLRLLYVGGEALPLDLAARWAAGRWLENGYGPTECTVTGVRGRIRGDDKVIHIGRAVAGCQAWVMDDELRPVAPGAIGELCLSGAGLARGYRGLPALTAEKFVVHETCGRLYRTGDLARVLDDGQLECLGRMDTQVKLRGYRIELEAIEAVLAACPGVRAAACTVQREALAGFIVAADPGAPPDAEAVRDAVSRALPAYMVPARVGVVDELPTTSGGKLDRARLPALTDAAPRAAAHVYGSDAERAVAAAFGDALRRNDSIAPAADFFVDLGGDSLAATAVIVQLRSQGWQAAVRDLYTERTVAALALCLTRDRMPERTTRARSTGAASARVCTLAQSLWIAIECAVASLLVYAGGGRVLTDATERFAPWQAALILLAAGLGAWLAWLPCSVAVTVALKRVLIGRYRARRAPVWGSYYLRHWIVTHAAGQIPWPLIQGTAAQSWVLRALGARVGRRVYLHRGVDFAHGGWDLLSLGDDVSVGQDAALRLADLDQGELVVAPVRLADGATVETRASVEGGAAIGRNGCLGALSWLGTGEIPENERWEGAPAAPVGSAGPTPALTRGRHLPGAVHTLLLLGVRLGLQVAYWLPWVAIAALAPAWADKLPAWLSAPTLSLVAITALGGAAALAMVTGLTLQALVLRRLSRIEEGVVSTWSWEGIRIGAAAASVESAGRWLSGSLAWPLWLRAAGMRLGRGCEISTILDVVPGLIEIGEESFFADGIYLAPPRRQQGTITLRRTSFGRNTFLGNHAVIPPGYQWPEGLFVGVATVPEPGEVRANTAWFGRPALELPRQARVVDRRLTHEPSMALYATRMFWELLRLALPTLPIALAAVWWQALDGRSLGAAVLYAPALTLTAAVAGCAATIGAKWALLGRVRPREHAFWSCWCGRWDWLYVAWAEWAAPWLRVLEGTLLLNCALRAAGATIGRGVALGPGFSQIVDPDMLRLGDGATVACHFQAHTFEDRVLRLGYIDIGAGASAGDGAVMLYGASLGAGAWLAPQSVVMKGDAIASGARALGAPAQVETKTLSLTAAL
ncbi:MAG TPA: amino acid adenylation domain-containing protein [Terriglobales bacterium]|nr:amino acid adenylation domain-containing protein [Terriglobales bacterium]